MHNRLCDMFGIEVPIFAFSHCRDVVVEVSRAGGFGVLGMARMSPTRLREELRWIDEHIDGKPYGIDVLMPTTYSDAGELKFDAERLFPEEHLRFVRGLLDSAGVPPLPEGERWSKPPMPGASRSRRWPARPNTRCVTNSAVAIL